MAAAALAVCALGLALATPAEADIRVDGNLHALRLSATGDSLAEVLARFEAQLAVRCRSSVPLQAAVSGDFSGSLSQVVARLLDGYNYVIRHDHGLAEIVVLGRAGESAVTPKVAPTASIKPPASRWR